MGIECGQSTRERMESIYTGGFVPDLRHKIQPRPIPEKVSTRCGDIFTGQFRPIGGHNSLDMYINNHTPTYNPHARGIAPTPGLQPVRDGAAGGRLTRCLDCGSASAVVPHSQRHLSIYTTAHRHEISTTMPGGGLYVFKYQALNTYPRAPPSAPTQAGTTPRSLTTFRQFGIGLLRVS